MEGLTLYEINAEIDAIIDEYVDIETGEISDEGCVLLDNLHMNKMDKIVNIGLYYKNLDSFSKQCKEAKKQLDQKVKIAENKKNRLKKLIEDNLNGEKINFPNIAISWRKSSAIETTDEYDIEALSTMFPELVRTTKILDKTAAKKILQEKPDVGIKGIVLKIKKNLQIK